VLTGERQELDWQIPRALLRPGLNNLQWSVDRETLTLEGLDWQGPY
jgi:hypothetical protein